MSMCITPYEHQVFRRAGPHLAAVVLGRAGEKHEQISPVMKRHDF